MELSQKELDILKELKISDKHEVIVNSHSRASITLEPEAVALYDYIKGSEHIINFPEQFHIKLTVKDISQFKIALQLFRKLYPKEYQVLLD